MTAQTRVIAMEGVKNKNRIFWMHFEVQPDGLDVRDEIESNQGRLLHVGLSSLKD